MKNKIDTYLTGGEVPSDNTGGNFGTYMSLANGLLSIIDTISNPPQDNKQPIYSRQSALDMVSPYATGGIVNLFAAEQAAIADVTKPPIPIIEDEEEYEEDIVETEDAREKNNTIAGITKKANSHSLFSSSTSNSSTNHIINKESGGNYGALPYKKDGTLASSAVGKYQFLWNTHGKDIMKETGVKSKEEFRTNPQAQEQYYNKYRSSYLEPTAKKLLSDVQKKMPKATLADVEAMLHFAGEGNLKQAIKSGDFSKPLDAFGSSITSYIKPKMATGGVVDPEPVKDFFNKYLGSKNYTKRLLNQGYNNPVQTVKDRIINLNTATITNSNKQPSEYIAKNHNININSKENKRDGFSDDSVLAHELSHTAGAVGYGKISLNGNKYLNDKEVALLDKGNKANNFHDKLAGETKADMDTFRYLLKKNNIYDTGTQEFNKDFLKQGKDKLGKDANVKRFLDRYSDDEIIILMNSIASANLNNNNMAAFGATINGNNLINIEDNEVVETPDGQVMQAEGATHEQGGINIAVPDFTKIYSDRLTVDGKTMQERKLAREKKMSKLDKYLADNPTSQLTKNSFNRMKASLDAEDAEDMKVQEQFRQATAQFATGGTVSPIPYNLLQGINWGQFLDPTMMENVTITGNREPVLAANPISTPVTIPQANPISTAGVSPVTPITTPVTGAGSNVANPEATANQGFSLGDGIGLAGNIFNAVAPILNTIGNANATPPNVNRFRGFGRDALDVNTMMQDYVDSNRDNQISDVNSQFQAQVESMDNSAASVNTSRALRIGAEIQKQKVLNNINAAFNDQMVNILGQRTGLLNQRDNAEMSGEAQRDIMDKRDIDSFYSNMAENLTNFGTNVQGIGAAINKSQSNNQNLALLNSLAVNPIAVTKDGRIINKELTPQQAQSLVESGKYKWNKNFTELIPVK